MSELTIRALHPAVGAQIEGFDPEMADDPETIDRLRQVFDDRSVLLFRDLDIDEDHQRSLVYSLVGAAAAQPGDRPEATPSGGPMYISNKEDGGAAPYGRLLFHCDAMWAEHPQSIISLYGVEVGQPSAPTMFVSMVHAWETLPADLRARVEGLDARHGHEHHYPNRGGGDDVIDTYYEEAQSTVTPIARRHPRTGRTTLYVSQQATIEIIGVSERENEELLGELFAHLYAPDQVLHHEWRALDLVIWDNQAVQHARGRVDLDGPERTLRKVFGPMDLGGSTQLPKFARVGQAG